MVAWTLAVIAFMSAQPVTPIAGVPKEPFKAKILSVPRGDALTLSTAGQKYLVALYGVKCYELAPDAIKRDQEFIRERCQDTEVDVKPVSAIAGLTYVEIVLPAGQILNKVLLEEGLAELDVLSAGQNVEYRRIISAVKKAESKPSNTASVDRMHESTQKPREHSSQTSAEFQAKQQTKLLTELKPK